MKTIKRRRKLSKTDYAKRIKFLKGGTPRAVFRKTNKYLIAQYVESKEAQDRVIIGLTSKELMNHGWPKEATGSLKSTAAAYLVGFLLGKNIQSKKLKDPIVDFGMYRVLEKSKLQAFIKGLVDSGVKIPHKKEAFPSEDRIKGSHMEKKIPFDTIKSNISNKNIVSEKPKNKGMK